MSIKSQVTCWVVTTGVAGMENQCLGLAHALGIEPVVKRISLVPPWKQLSPFLRVGLSHAFSSKGDGLAPPWPDLMIASGRAGAMACLYARRESGRGVGAKKTVTVHIQNPVIDPSRFDLVALPRHDDVLGENVVTTRGALHRVTPSLLVAEKEKFRDAFAALPEPRMAVLIGGANSVYQFSVQDMAFFAAQLVAVAKETGGSLMITSSRRTSAEALSVLRDAVRDIPHVLWDGGGINPYYGMLGWADAILVTADSVNMTSEACATGKPVHVVPLTGGSHKFRLFHQALRDDGYTRPFKGKLEHWIYQPLRDVELVAARVRECLETRTKRG